MFITILLLLLLFYFIIRPAWRVYMSVRRQQQATRDFFSSMGFDTGTAGHRRAGKRQASQQPSPKKKKIDPSTGEYVKYEDITVEQASYTETRDDSGGSTRTVVEQQITDIEWEDVK